MNGNGQALGPKGGKGARRPSGLRAIGAERMLAQASKLAYESVGVGGEAPEHLVDEGDDSVAALESVVVLGSRRAVDRRLERLNPSRTPTL